MATIPPCPPDIATFERPPVVEVVAAVRTTSMRPATFLTLGSLWREALQDEYPRLELAQPYKAPLESFDEGGGQPGFQFEISMAPELPRLGLHSASGDGLLQLQADWLGTNWRRVQPQTEYDRWERRRESFAHNWGTVSSWLAGQDDVVSPLQCEVTYVNHIHPQEGLWSDYSDAAELFAGPAASGQGSANLEQFQWQGQFRVPADGGQRGRVVASIQPARSLSGEVMLVFEITARVSPGSSDDVLGAVMDGLDVARNSVVSSFVELTSAQAKEAWGLKT